MVELGVLGSLLTSPYQPCHVSTPLVWSSRSAKQLRPGPKNRGKEKKIKYYNRKNETESGVRGWQSLGCCSLQASRGINAARPLRPHQRECPTAREYEPDVLRGMARAKSLDVDVVSSILPLLLLLEAKWASGDEIASGGGSV